MELTCKGNLMCVNYEKDHCRFSKSNCWYNGNGKCGACGFPKNIKHYIVKNGSSYKDFL